MENIPMIKKFFYFSILSVSLNVSAAGFDCLKASTAVEHMVCDNTALSALDSAMTHLYQSKKDNNLKEIQRGWIKTKRDSAKSVDELNTLYAEHIQFLSEYAKVANQINENNNTVKQPKPTVIKGKLQLSDFSNDFISVDGNEYSTQYQDMNRSNYVLRCADAMMIDVMNIWRKDSAKKNETREFSRLRNNVYNGLWNMTVDNIDSKVNTQEMRTICDLLV
ncbi:lysozyme inhibitor LprI family protein, partial [Serratia sp. ASV30]|uniref:lysozyme inhibitor LprI family protein n=1 Tax=Serratia sp. ASV30 TaxID=2795127 RepID=UPI00351C9DAE